MSTIKTYMCNKKIVAIASDSRRSRNAVSVSDGIVSVKLRGSGDWMTVTKTGQTLSVDIQLYDSVIFADGAWSKVTFTHDMRFPRGRYVGGEFVGTMVQASCNRGIVRAEIMPEEAMFDPVACLAGGLGSLSWSRKVTISKNEAPALSTKITISLNHAPLPCHWQRTRLYGITNDPSVKRMILLTHANKAGGMIGNSQSDAYKGDAGKSISTEAAETSFVPGELLQLEWTIETGDQIFYDAVAGRYFASPAMTGGIITAINGEGVDRQVSVYCQGETIVCTPTDFAGYTVGDWIFLLKNTPQARVVDRDEEYTDAISNDDEAAALAENLRPIPVTVNDVGAESGGFEVLPYTSFLESTFRQVFEVSRHTGTIISIDADTRTASVNIQDEAEHGLHGVFENVDIFYHCPGEPITENGHTAFSVGDQVIVINEYGGSDPAINNLKIMGFDEGLKSCEEEGDCILIVSSPSGSEAFAWDTLNDELLVEKADFSSVVAQVQALGFDFSPKKLEPSQTEEISHTIGGHPYYYQISGIFNQPDFFINTHQMTWAHPYEGDITLGAFPYRYTWTGEGDGISTFEWQNSVVIDPDTEEVKGLHILDFDYNPGGETASRQSAVHYMFDTDVDALEHNVIVGQFGYELEYPHPATYCKTFRTWTERRTGYWYDGEEFDYATAFADYNLYRPFQAQGIAANASYVAVFENASYCKNWRDPEETLEDFQNTFPPRLTTAADDQGVCITEGGDPAYPRGYVRNLRIYVKEREPQMNALEAKAFELINFEREQRDLDPFVWNHVLGASAARHSNNMADSDFANTRPVGGTSWHIGSDNSTIESRITDAGYFLHHNRGTYVEEEGVWYNGQANENVGGISYPLPETDEQLPGNVVAATYWEVINQPEYAAKGLAEHMVALWMASTEGHRELMIGESEGRVNDIDFSECGISAVESAGIAYWTLNVGTRFNTWPGYGAVATDSLCAYMDDCFTWDALNDGSRVPQMYLI